MGGGAAADARRRESAVLTMPPHIVRAGRGGDHRHADRFTSRAVAGWLSCPVCQHGWTVPVSEPVARAIATILAAVTGGPPPLEGGEPQ